MSNTLGNESSQLDYWNNARIKKMSTDSEWLNEVYDDVGILVDLSKTKGISDTLRLSYTERAIEALQEVKEFLK